MIAYFSLLRTYDFMEGYGGADIRIQYRIVRQHTQLSLIDIFTRPFITHAQANSYKDVKRIV
jgi:hypothetical protein